MENKKEWYGCEKHEHFASYADKYIDGELTEKQISELFEHVEECAECRRCLEITVKTDEAVDVPEMASLPRGLHAGIMESVKTDAAQAVIREQHIPKISRLVPVAAAFLCIFLIVALFITTPEGLTDGGDSGKNTVSTSAPLNGTPDGDLPSLSAPSQSAPPSIPEAESTSPSTDTEAAPETTAESNKNNSAPAPISPQPSDTGEPQASLDSDIITFIIFGLCAIFAFSSVISLIIFIFAAKKKQ